MLWHFTLEILVVRSWPWCLVNFLKTYNLDNIFWMIGTWALIFHMSFPCDKTFPWEPTDLTWWHWHLTYSWQTFNVHHLLRILSERVIIFHIHVFLVRARAAHRICRILRFFGKICDRNPENATRIFRILDHDRRHLEFCLWQQSGLRAAYLCKMQRTINLEASCLFNNLQETKGWSAMYR
jgi:hypothetical protein